MKLGLGTVQFGMNYGVSNTGGQTSLEEAREILDLAEESGISVIDTAAVYGESEEVLGKLLRKRHSFRITTKFPALIPQDRCSFESNEVVSLMTESLKRLGQRNVYGLLLHRADELLSPYGDEIMKGLQKCKRMGLAEKVGVSVYAEDRINELINSYPIDLIQVPVNLFDQRLVRNGFLNRCQSMGIEVQARSVFLQGLLCMEPYNLPAYFRPYVGRLQSFHRYISERGITPVEAALSFVDGLPEIDAFVCGVNRCDQLRQLVASMRNPAKGLDFSKFASTDSSLLNPSLWKTS
ncbi:aldo/keto reductase [Cohnella herbarum]|uniref:Aryl-alcohol dehydrogenase n=1 Tax=Cohnella herbarum TaxID=2728023 RepID=A0A7Z2VPP6_9BACL|nr:aldo/keto reductase [Cohnella herbarum]QJD87191.1 aryl-alcohol dehydrogenase [Cohnella herbarum]